MVTTVNIHEAKTHLSRLLVQVAAGDEIIIAKSGHPVARLVPARALPPRRPGRFRGQVRGSEVLLESSPQDESMLWSLGSDTDPLRGPASATP